MNLKVNVPYEIDKGTYTFRVLAVNNSVLPLTINVSEHGTLKTEFTSEQANMQGHAKSDFNFRTKLNNQTGEKQLYALTSNAPRGWSVVFKPNYQQATSVEIEPGQNKDITVEVKPPFGIKAGKYTIPIMARTNATSANLDLEVDITGTFEMELSTPSGLLSSSITAGRKSELTGCAQYRLNGYDQHTNELFKPRGWEVTFSNDTIPFIAAGETAGLTAQIKAYEKSIPGDYVISLTAQTPETSSAASFRIAVKTSPLWGWLGIFIILSSIWVIFYLFRNMEGGRAMQTTTIEVKNLTKKYGDFTAVNNLSLKIGRGEVFGLLGPNGAGKSTTILMLMGLTEPTSGQVSVCGIDSVRNPIEVKKRVGYLPEDVGFYDDLTGFENLVYTATLNNIPEQEAKQRVNSLMNRIGLEEKKEKSR